MSFCVSPRHQRIAKSLETAIDGWKCSKWHGAEKVGKLQVFDFHHLGTDGRKTRPASQTKAKFSSNERQYPLLLRLMYRGILTSQDLVHHG